MTGENAWGPFRNKSEAMPDNVEAAKERGRRILAENGWNALASTADIADAKLFPIIEAVAGVLFRYLPKVESERDRLLAEREGMENRLAWHDRVLLSSQHGKIIRELEAKLTAIQQQLIETQQECAEWEKRFLAKQQPSPCGVEGHKMWTLVKCGPYDTDPPVDTCLLCAAERDAMEKAAFHPLIYDKYGHYKCACGWEVPMSSSRPAQLEWAFHIRSLAAITPSKEGGK